MKIQTKSLFIGHRKCHKKLYKYVSHHPGGLNKGVKQVFNLELSSFDENSCMHA